MRHSLEKVVHVASVREATADILGSPFDVLDATGDVFAEDVVTLNFLVWNVRIVHADKNDPGSLTAVDKHLVENLRDRNLLVVWIEINFPRYTFCIVKFDDSMCPAVNEQCYVSLSSQPSAPIFNSSPVMDVTNFFFNFYCQPKREIKLLMVNPFQRNFFVIKIVWD